MAKNTLEPVGVDKLSTDMGNFFFINWAVAVAVAVACR